jgi:hypothetical protein
VTSQPPELEQQQVSPPDPTPPPPDVVSLTGTTMQSTIHRVAMSAAMNQVLGSRAATPHESRSQLIGIAFNLVIPIRHLYPHVTTRVLFIIH